MNTCNLLLLATVSTLGLIAPTLNAQTAEPRQPKPAVFVSPSEAETPPVADTVAEPLNPMACAMLPSSATAVLSAQLPNTGEPPSPAATLPASAATTPVAIPQPYGMAGYCTNPIVGPTEYYAGTMYQSPNIPPVGSVPSTAIIYQVSWTYSLSRTPVGQRVWICDSVNCFEITGSTSGTTTHFNGHHANTDFAFDFYVTGSGQLSPWVNTSDLQVCNNYSY